MLTSVATHRDDPHMDIFGGNRDRRALFDGEVCLLDYEGFAPKRQTDSLTKYLLIQPRVLKTSRPGVNFFHVPRNSRVRVVKRAVDHFRSPAKRYREGYLVRILDNPGYGPYLVHVHYLKGLGPLHQLAISDLDE